MTVQVPVPASSSLYDLPFPVVEDLLLQAGVRPVHALALWRALYGGRAPLSESLAALPPPLQRWISEQVGVLKRFSVERPLAREQHFSEDGLTQKYLLQLPDSRSVETVLMGYEGRRTACLSTQVGCAMGCVFCATGQMGFTRHLRPGEIVAQALHCQAELRVRGQEALRNVVLMGMGEPLHNYDSVMTALDIISDTRGLNIGPRRITVSTVGVVPGILRLAEENRPYNLAVSLHGASEEERAALLPVSQRWPLVELIAACRVYGERTGRRIFFQWTLIEGVNDSPAQAARVGALLAGLRAHVNLIPLNRTQGFGAGPSSSDAADQFQRTLKLAGIPSTVRQRRGIDVAAGCGQLQTARAVGST